jgi:hypothetical protein
LPFSSFLRSALASDMACASKCPARAAAAISSADGQVSPTNSKSGTATRSVSELLGGHLCKGKFRFIPTDTGRHLSGIWSVFAGRITVTAPDGRQETTHLGSSERRTNRGTAAAEREGAHIKLLDGAAPIVRSAAIKSTASISVTAPRGKPVLRDPPVRTRPGPQWDEGVAWRIPRCGGLHFRGRRSQRVAL